MIKVNNICKKYKNKIVLNNITYTFNKLNFYSISGQSGQGKTTFLYALYKLIDLDNGSIIYFNKNINDYDEEELINYRKNEVSFIFQEYNLFPFLSVKDNIVIANQNVDEDRIKDLLIYYEMVDKINTKVSELSGGEQQRVAIIRAVIKQPKILFADEPTSNLDDINAKKTYNLFQNLKENGSCVIVVSHDKSIQKYNTKSLMMKDGKLYEK